MLTRRDALVGAMTAGAILRTRTSFSKHLNPRHRSISRSPRMRATAIPTSTATRSNFPSSPVAFTRPNWRRPRKCRRFIACCTSNAW